MMLSDVCVSDVCRVHPVGGRRVRLAGWIARIGWSGPAPPAWLKAAPARFRCRPGRGHIVAAACLQLVLRNTGFGKPLIRWNDIQGHSGWLGMVLLDGWLKCANFKTAWSYNVKFKAWNCSNNFSSLYLIIRLIFK